MSDHDVPLMKPMKAINYEDLIDMTAMVDIVFFLLIFFLVTSLQAIDSSIDLPRPAASGGAGSPQLVVPDQEAEPTEITVRIDHTDHITVDGTDVLGADELLIRLRGLLASAGHPSVLLIIGSGDATHGTLVTVLDAGQELGFDRIKLSVADESDDR